MERFLLSLTTVKNRVQTEILGNPNPSFYLKSRFVYANIFTSGS